MLARPRRQSGSFLRAIPINPMSPVPKVYRQEGSGVEVVVVE
jgi:hypothetical protein